MGELLLKYYFSCIILNDSSYVLYIILNDFRIVPCTYSVQASSLLLLLLLFYTKEMEYGFWKPFRIEKI